MGECTRVRRLDRRGTHDSLHRFSGNASPGAPVVEQVRAAAQPDDARIALTAFIVFVTLLLFAFQADAQYDSERVSLIDRISLSEFGGGANVGNDCWGYVSPDSGREYALMGLYGKTAFVEITDPANPVIVDSVSHPSSSWSDIKVYEHYAYVSNETGGNIQVIDLADIDNGNVSLVNTLWPQTAHNVAINEEVGHLYILGSRIVSSLHIYDLAADPVDPPLVGNWNGQYIHDAQGVTMKRAPYVGRHILFACCSSRFYIVDVTDPENTFTVAATTYPDVGYCHQGWLSEDQRFFYLNDEGDELAGYTPTTRTIMFDVTDLFNPEYIGSFTTGRQATDHNLYVRDNFIFEANYRSGLHIFDGSDPVNPVHVGFFDTYPSNDRAGYDGAWSVYPYFPSGTVIVSDINRGLFILDVSEALAYRRIALDVDPLVAGQNASIDASNLPSGETTWFIYSLSGTEPKYIPSVNAMVGLKQPKVAGIDTADGSGNASINVNVPGGASGLQVWLQAIADSRTSNIVDTVVN